MPLTVKYKTLNEKKFDFPYRIFISGSSQSGKTYLSGKLLRSSLFQEKPSQIFYYHPDYLADCPVDWHDTQPIQVTYHTGVPTLDDLCKLENNSCVVLDDLYEECVNAQSIDYLFRVLSGKKNISVIIMSQRYFAQGKFAMNIRNNCNYTVLMRNVDGKINSRIAALMSLQKPINKAIELVFPDNYWPYLFIDSTPRGQVSKLRVYTQLFGRFQEVFSDEGMKAFVISAKDFLKHFKLKSDHLAEPKNGKHETHQNIDTSETKFSDTRRSDQRERLIERAKRIRRKRKIERNIQQYQKLA